MDSSHSDNIDYTEKIRNFQAMVDNYNEEIALNYLTKYNWDETKAAAGYHNETHRENTNLLDNPHYIDDIRVSNNRRDNYQRLAQNENDQRENLIPRNEDREEEQGFIYRWLWKPMVSLATWICGRKDTTLEENRIFADLPERVNNLSTFSTLIKTRIGMLVVYTPSDISYFENMIHELRSHEYMMDILKVNFCIYPVSANSPEGRRIVSLVSNDLIYPVIVYAFNNRENNSLNRGSVIHRIEGQVDFETLRNSVMRAIEIKDNMVLTQKTPNQSLTHAELIEQQKEEIAILERMEEEKKKKQKEIEEELELEKKQQMEKLKQIEQKKLEKLNQIPDEPVQGHPDTTVIILRYPDGNRRIERRFLKTDRIKVLYDFVESLGTEIYTEPDCEKFELIQPFPFKIYSDYDKTLEEERLFPNAVIQIREI